jgi:hypothetical protein
MLGQVSQFGPTLYNFRFAPPSGRTSPGGCAPQVPAGLLAEWRAAFDGLMARRRALLATAAASDPAGVTEVRRRHPRP